VQVCTDGYKREIIDETTASLVEYCVSENVFHSILFIFHILSSKSKELKQIVIYFHCIHCWEYFTSAKI